jgi:hypothetical protein
VDLEPAEAYVDSTLRGSATYHDPDGDPEGVSTYRWLVDGAPIASGEVPQSLLLPLDGGLTSTDGQAPVQSQGLAFVAGRFGQAVGTSAASDSRLAYAAAGNVDPNEGSIDMWVNLTYDLDDPAYDGYPRLFSYVIDDEHQLCVEVNQDRLIVTSRNEGSYYGTWPAPPGWHAGEWHHLTATWSASADCSAIYYDGALAAEGSFSALTGSASVFHLGSAETWSVMDATFDDVRLSRRALSAAEVAAAQSRGAPAPHNEVALPPGQVAVGDLVTFELTPCDDSSACGAPASASVTVGAPPLGKLAPAPTLLAPGTVSVTLSLTTTAPANCRWSEHPDTSYGAMPHGFQQGQGTTGHATLVEGFVDLDDRWFYVRCDDVGPIRGPTEGRSVASPLRDPDAYERSTHLRVLSAVDPPFPRTGNLWGWWGLAEKGLPYLARQDLLLGADGLTAAQIAELRALNPHILVLTSINAVENHGLPDDYYLKDVDGNRIEVWPDSYRLNLTKMNVAEHQADVAVQTLLDSGLMADGVFFDNVFTTQSWLTHDIYGNEVEIDADEDGLPDDPDDLDAAWKAGVFHEIEAFRARMPHAIVSGHAMDIHEPGIAELFNGIGIGFWTADVIQGDRAFGELWTRYTDWLELAKEPPVTMFESSPLDEIAYGYDYAPWAGKVPSSTLDFARTYYPWMRFGLALTLMHDGYFAHEFGDTWHGNDWWYDELDVDLGTPLGPARPVDLGGPPPVNQIENGGFEEPLAYPWDFWVNTGAGCLADVTRDSSDAASGSASARLEVTATSGVDWHVEFAQYDRSLQQDVAYDLVFWARSDHPRAITLSAQKDSPDWDNYGLWQQVTLETTWRPYTVTFQANATVSDARIQFLVGASTGSVWLDDVRMTEHPPDVYGRAFAHGLVLLNATREAQTIDVGPGYRRLVGNQAPRYETILDDAGPAFSTTGSWITQTYDSGQWQASGPFYHDWEESCHEGNGEARWDLPITVSDTYTVTAWWPAAPESTGWSAAASYQVIVGEEMVAEATFDQRKGGDRWHVVGAAPLDPGDQPYVRLSCPAGDPCSADALHLRSLGRYNDGSLAEQVTLQPMDGIVLRDASPCDPADVDGDGDVNVEDIQTVAGLWRCEAGDDCYDDRCDLTQDGTIDVVDIMVVASCWGCG